MCRAVRAVLLVWHVSCLLTYSSYPSYSSFSSLVDLIANKLTCHPVTAVPPQMNAVAPCRGEGLTRGRRQKEGEAYNIYGLCTNALLTALDDVRVTGEDTLWIGTRKINKL